MILLREINDLSYKLLERIYKQSRHHQVRTRAQALILLHKGTPVKEVEKIFSISHKTIYNWISRWETGGMVGLYNKPGRGRKQTFTPEQKEQITTWAESEPKQLKKVAQKIQETWNIKPSKKTIKRVLKSMRMSWHRMRRGVGGTPPTQDYEDKKEQLKELKRLDELGEINLWYLDESGFSLIPSVPYGWQRIGEYLQIPSRRSQQLNVLGIMNRSNQLETYVSTQTINSDVVIACIDTFFPNPDKPTVIVTDQASIHKSNSIWDKTEEWKDRNITLFYLPTYSPHLNLIEILWRFIKYEWLNIEDYSSWESLVASVEKILKEFGENYVINFG